MKKNIIAFVAFAVALVFAIPANAQVKFGIKGGVNLNKVNVKGDFIGNNFSGKGDNAAGFFVGLTADAQLPIVGLGVDASLLYDNKVMKLDDDTKKTLQYISIPVNAKYTIGFSSVASVYFATGPQFSFNVGNRNISNWFDMNSNKDAFKLNSSEFSWNVGAGVTVLSHVRVGYNYNIALGNTYDIKESYGTANIASLKLKNNTHQISLTYLF